MGVCLALASSTLLATKASAQINIETVTGRIAEPGFGAGARSAVAYSAGNVDFFDLRGELTTFFATPHADAPEDDALFWFRDRVLVYGSAGYRSSNGEPNAKEGYGHLRYTRMQWLSFGGEVYGQAQFDEFRLLRRRLVAGVGARSVVVNHKHVTLWLGAGPMYESERRNIPAGAPDPIYMTNYRLNSYATLLLTFVPDLVTLVSTTYAQPRFDDFKDLQLLNETRLQVEITDRLLISSDLNYRLDSQPPVGVERRDIRLGQSLMLTL